MQLLPLGDSSIGSTGRPDEGEFGRKLYRIFDVSIGKETGLTFDRPPRIVLHGYCIKGRVPGTGRFGGSHVRTRLSTSMRRALSQPLVSVKRKKGREVGEEDGTCVYCVERQMSIEGKGNKKSESATTDRLLVVATEVLTKRERDASANR